jgi:hypothetical protein
MTRKRTAMASAAVALFLVACSQADGEATAAAATQSTASSSGVAFEARPAIRAGVQALPRLVGDTPAIAAINADLDRFDTAAGREVCGGPGTVERGVAQPMTGPGYVSFLISEFVSCEGAAHPSIGQTGLTYDLSTGRRVDWAAAIPGLGLSTFDMDGEGDGQVVTTALYQSAALAEWYGGKMLASTDAEWLEQCRDLFSTEMLADRYFKVWLDAQSGGVAVLADFPHVALACAETAVMTGEEMRGFGVTPAIIEAVLAAKAAGNFAPKT